MFVFGELGTAESEAFVDDYVAGIAERSRRFHDGIVAAGGPELAGDSEGFAALWIWFVESYVDATSHGPFYRAGVDVDPVWWMIPDELSDEVLFFAVGVASWFELLLGDEFEFERLRETRRSSPQFNMPVHFIDVRTRNMCASAMEGRRSDPSRLGYLFSMLRDERRRRSTDHSAPLTPVLPTSPDLVLDDPVFDDGEIGIEFNLVASHERRARFDELLRKSPILRGIKDHEPGQYLSGTFHGDSESVRSAVDKLWKESE